jgi:hypothetical protein
MPRVSGLPSQANPAKLLRPDDSGRKRLTSWLAGKAASNIALEDGGGGGIRTHEAFQPAGFQDRSHQPLDHPSVSRGAPDFATRDANGNE